MRQSLIVIQARMGSSRLPGKVLRPLAESPVLAWAVAAARAGVPEGQVVVATTTEPVDDDVASLAGDLGVETVRGPVQDVLQRYLTAFESFGGDHVVRLTADCPLLDPSVIAMAVAAFSSGDVDYLSTVAPRTLPRGLDVEVVAGGALRAIADEAEGVDRVHVTSYIPRHPGRFRMAGLAFQPDASDLRVTLDTEEDATLLDAVVAELGPRASSRHELIPFLRSRPDLVAINADVRQKLVDEG